MGLINCQKFQEFLILWSVHKYAFNIKMFNPMDLTEFLPESTVKKAWELFLDNEITPDTLIEEFESLLLPHMDEINRALPKPTTVYVMAKTLVNIFSDFEEKSEGLH